MPKALTRFVVLVALGSTSFFGTAERVRAQTYPIDCAILLCLSGGWPASVPCSRARAEFIHAMAYANTPDLQRHQTTALGLAALADSSRET